MLLRSAVCPGGTGRASSGTTLGTVSAAGASESGDGPWGFLDLCGDMGGGRTRDVRAFPTWSGTTLQGSAATNGSASRQRPGHRAATSHSFRVTTRSLSAKFERRQQSPSKCDEPEARCGTEGPTGGLMANPRSMPSALCLDSVVFVLVLIVNPHIVPLALCLNSVCLCLGIDSELVDCCAFGTIIQVFLG